MLLPRSAAAIPAALNFTALIPSQNVTNPNNFPRCFTPDDRGPLPTTFAQCRPILDHRIAVGLHPTRMIAFSRRHATGPDYIHIPHEYSEPHLSCAVIINSPPGGAGIDFWSLAEVQSAAVYIAQKCVIQSPHMGGWVTGGVSDALWITVVGIRSRPPSDVALGEEWG